MIRSLLPLLVLPCILLGCGGEPGPELGTVEGVVTYGGAPVENATVTFDPVLKGRASYAQTDREGRYVMRFAGQEGVLLGQHKVTVSTATEAAYDDDGNVTEEGRPELVPAPLSTDGETKTVEPGHNEFNFEL